MAKNQRLHLYMNGERVAELKKLSTGAIEFQYHSEWVENFFDLPISRRLPVTEEVQKGPDVINYFENLLPDSDLVREKIAAQTKAQSKSTYDLLASIGRDCVGALQIIPADLPAPGMEEARGEEVSETEIAETLKNLFNQPLGLDAQGEFRISLAGNQEKTAYLKMDGKWYKPLGSTPTTHIFKPAMGVFKNGLDMSSSVENEWLCLKICKEFGLDVAEATMETFDQESVLVVERFDRRWKGKRLFRLPQEDMCQALGVSSAHKYQNDGGPGIKEIMNLLNESNENEKDRKDFFKAQVVFWLLAGIDGHAKNFSIFWQPGGFKMTPIYDVISASPIMGAKGLSPHKAKMAMSVGENSHYKVKDIARRHWLQMSKVLRYDEDEIRSILEEVVRKTPSVIKAINGIAPKGFPDDVLNKILNGIEERARLLEEN